MCADETFDVTAEEEAQLLASIREAEQGQVVEASVVLRELGRRYGLSPSSFAPPIARTSPSSW